MQSTVRIEHPEIRLSGRLLLKNRGHRTRTRRGRVVDHSVLRTCEIEPVAKIGRSFRIREGLGAARIILLDTGEAGPVDTVRGGWCDGMFLCRDLL